MKNPIFRGINVKLIYRGKLLKKGGTWTVCRLKGRFAKKRGVGFFRRVDTPMFTAHMEC